MKPLDEDLQNVLLDDREVLREEHDSERSRIRAMGVLAASAMPAGSSSVSTQSWLAKFASSKVFLSSFFVVAIVGGATFVTLNPAGDNERVNERMPPPIEVLRQAEDQDRAEPQVVSPTLQPSVAAERTEEKNVQNKTSPSERQSLKLMTSEESFSASKNVDASEAIQRSDNQSEGVVEEKDFTVYQKNTVGVKVTVNPMKKEK